MENEQKAMQRIASLGIPAVGFARTMRFEGGMDGIVVEDLSQNGKFKVKEFSGFDMSQVKNGISLQKKFKKHYFTLVRAGVKMSELGRHSKKADLNEEIKKCFFVVVNPNTNLGRIVVGDADHIEF